VEVVPHFWETPWFRALTVILALAAAIGIGWRIARNRAQRRLARLELQTAREKERARIARDLHDDLGASLTEISMLANLAAEDDAAPGHAREPLAQIAGKAHTLVGALDEIVWAVNPRHDTLASVADYLPAVASEFLDSTDIALRLDVARDLPLIALDAERRHGLFLAVREALNNAVKHSGAREISLSLRAPDHRLEIELRDDGRGFDAAGEHCGDGLRNLRERMIALGGEARIESIPGTGTSVRLSLPLP
jgi:signal transduction histidine kinase